MDTRMETCFAIEEDERNDTCCIDVPVYMGYSQQQLRRAFEIVENSEDWRGPINCLVSLTVLHMMGVYLRDIDFAIRFYTGTIAEFYTNPHGDGDLWRIVSVGYRMGPAGDH